MRALFAPSHPSHLMKNRLLVDKLLAEGCSVRVLCLDRALPPRYATRDRLAETGLPFELLEIHGFPAEGHWIRQALRRRSLLRAMQRHLSSVPIDVVIVGTDGDLVTRTLIEAARRCGLPTVHVADGLIVGPNPAFRQPLLMRWKGRLADRVRRSIRAGGPRGTGGATLTIVMSNRGKREFARLGVDPGRVLVAGSPEYLRLLEEGGPPLAEGRELEIRNALGVAAERPMILFAHQTLELGDAQEQALVRTMVTGARECAATLVVKFHPRSHDAPPNWRAWATREGFGDTDVVFTKERWPSLDLLRLSAACVTVYSTIALEALIFQTPLILVAYTNCPWSLLFGGEEAVATVADRPAALKSAIIRAVRDPRSSVPSRALARAVLMEEIGGSSSRESLEVMFRAVRELGGAREHSR